MRPVVLRRWLACLLVACLGAWAGCRAVRSPGPDPVDFAMRAPWIGPADPHAQVAQFRKVVLLPSSVRRAWVAVAAHEGFEVVVNGESAGRQFLWRPTRAFQTGLSEEGQRVISRQPLLDLSFPREYQWDGHRTDHLPVFIDIAPLLVRGRNVVALEVETRAAPASVALEGEILLWSGERVPLGSDSGFKIAPRPPAGGRAWTLPDFSDADWPMAVPAVPPSGSPLRVLDPDIYREPFAGRWVSAPQVILGASVFEADWSLPHAPSDAFLRIISNRPFQLFVNDRPARIADTPAQELDEGDWIIGPRTSVDAPAAAEALDPDEVGSLFVGPRFSVPAAGGTTTPAFEPGAPGTLLVGGRRMRAPEPRTSSGAGKFGWEARLRGTAMDAPFAVPFAKTVQTAPAGLPPPPPTADQVGTAPEQVAPKDLARPDEHTVYYAYSVQRLLRVGPNHIAVRLAAPEGPSAWIWPPKLAVDGEVKENGTAIAKLASQGGWTFRAEADDGSPGDALDVVPGGLADAPTQPSPTSPLGTLPPLQYRGTVEDPSVTIVALVVALATMATALLALVPYALRRAKTVQANGQGEPLPEVHPLDGAMASVIPAGLVLLAAILVDLSWGERDELLWSLAPSTWRLVLAVAVSAGVGGALVACFAPSRAAAGTIVMRRWDGSWIWRFAVGLCVALTVVLRAYAMQAQPLDDDELASAQAAIAIARTGLPRYSADVYYTRGALYHYLAGGAVRLFGETIWALRLPSVAFAAGTAWLLYLVGARLLGSRWTGLIAASLYAVHPYAIFVGHLVRFYQQQQFFALATAYWFCRGFVTEQRMSARYLALGAFSAACVSQELSVVFVAPLFVIFLVFAEKKPRSEMAPFWVVSACAATLILTDILVFQTRCLTKLEGISPNVEATLAFHFGSPLNLLALFVSYSRLHVVLSLLLVAGLPLLVREGEANTLALLGILVMGVLCTNLFVTGESLRYQYWLLPVWMVLGVQAVRALGAALARLAERDGADAHRWIGVFAGVVAVVAVLMSWSPWRILGSYDITLLGDSTSAFSYVRAHLRGGDRVAATEPHAHAGQMEVGRIDYDLAIPLLHDFVYRKDGRLVDRNAGAQVISTLDQLRDALASHERVWVLVNREKFRSRGQDVSWEYPAARVEQFLRENLEVQFQSYMWTVFLWDAHAGKLQTLPPTARLSWATP